MPGWLSSPQELDSGVVIVVDTGAGDCGLLCTLLTTGGDTAPPRSEATAAPEGGGGRGTELAAAAALWAAVEAAWSVPEVPPPSAEELEARAARDRAVTAASLVHGWDVRLRKAVSAHLERGASSPRHLPAWRRGKFLSRLAASDC